MTYCYTTNPRRAGKATKYAEFLGIDLELFGLAGALVSESAENNPHIRHAVGCGQVEIVKAKASSLFTPKPAMHFDIHALITVSSGSMLLLVSLNKSWYADSGKRHAEYIKRLTENWKTLHKVNVLAGGSNTQTKGLFLSLDTLFSSPLPRRFYGNRVTQDQMCLFLLNKNVRSDFRNLFDEQWLDLDVGYIFGKVVHPLLKPFDQRMPKATLRLRQGSEGSAFAVVPKDHDWSKGLDILVSEVEFNGMLTGHPTTLEGHWRGRKEDLAKWLGCIGMNALPCFPERGVPYQDEGHTFLLSYLQLPAGLCSLDMTVAGNTVNNVHGSIVDVAVHSTGSHEDVEVKFNLRLEA